MDKNKKITEKELNNARELAEMYLCSSILKNEIYGAIKMAGINERDISTLLAKKTGKPLNSVYRDKNTLTVYNAPSLFRYWKAMLDIYVEMNISQFPDLNDVLSKYQSCFYFISQIADARNLESAIEHHIDFIVDMLIFFEQNPLPTDKRKAKQPVLDKLLKHPKIEELITKERQKEISRQKEGMMRVD